MQNWIFIAISSMFTLLEVHFLEIGDECPLAAFEPCKKGLICKKKDNEKIGICSRKDPGKDNS